MKCLFLDPASNIGALSCVTDGTAVAFCDMDRRITDSEIVPLVERMLGKAGWTYKDLTHIACVTGPGGFTSLRTGVAFVNVLQDQLDLPVAGIHLSDVYAARMGGGERGVEKENGTSDSQFPIFPSFVWLHSTRIDQCFIRGFGSHAARWNEPTLVSVDDIAKEIPDGTFWAGELIPRHREKLKQVKEADPALLETALPGILQGLSFEKKALLPWYGRGW